MAERVHTYAAALAAEWYGGRTGREYRITALHDAAEAATPAYSAESGDGTLALAVASLWEADADPAADDARAFMEERLSGGLVRGPHMLWVPPRASVPSDEPLASDFVQRVQQAAAPLQPGGRGEVELPVAVQLAKMRDEGGYASVIGALGRWWTLITERVDGTYHVNSAQMRRAPQSSATREALFDRIGELSRQLNTGEALEFDATEAWTVQRLAAEPLGETGFAIAQAPPKIDPADGTLLRRLVRKRLKDAAAATADISAELRGVALIACYEYAEHENIGSFVKSLDPGLFAPFGLVVVVADGEVRPVFVPH